MERKEIFKLREMGYTMQKIADIAGCTRQNINQKIKNPNPKTAGASIKHGLSSKFSGRDVVRERTRIRDNHTCQKCGKKWEEGQRRFDIHHIEGLCGKNSRGYDSIQEIDKLITLCHKCHFSRHDFSKRIGGDWKIQ